MTDTELNHAAAKFMGLVRDGDGWYVNQDRSMRFAPADWSPATKIEHAWLVQAACKAFSFAVALACMKPKGVESYTWLATAPPRARVEAALAAAQQDRSGP